MEKNLKNTLDEKYIHLLKDILDNGVTKNTRNGSVMSVFGRQIRHNMAEGFPLLTTKKMAIKSVMSELKWFLRGSTDIRELRKMNCHIWDGDCYARYVRLEQWDLEKPMSKEEFFEKIDTDDSFNNIYGDLGPIYGKQWRDWDGIDQIAELLTKLKNNPDDRRLMVSAWRVDQIQEMTLPPCHYGFQVYTREMSPHERWSEYVKSKKDEYIPYHDKMIQELDDIGFPTRKISLAWSQRSADVPLGLPFNLASYGMLLTLIAKEVNMIPDELIVNIGDAHIYWNQLEGVQKQIKNYPHKYSLPQVKILSTDILNGEFDYKIHNYNSYGKINFPLSN